MKRSYEDFRVLDKHLHLCIYDRRFSQLSELPRSDALKDSPEVNYQLCKHLKHSQQPGLEDISMCVQSSFTADWVRFGNLMSSNKIIVCFLRLISMI